MGVFNKASLVLVPDGIKNGKLYSIKPTDGSGDFTFTRGSNLAATRVDENGLIEKGRENLLVQSNQFDTTWTLNGTAASGASGYDGTNDAWTIDKNSGSSLFLSVNTTTTAVCTLSIYVKINPNNGILLATDLATAYAAFNISDANQTTPIAPVGIDAKQEYVGNNFYRLSITTNGASFVRFYNRIADGSAYDNGTATHIIQDAQLEKGLVATNYIETGATTAKAGVLENLPRIDYTGGTPSLLLEPSRTNDFKYSEAFATEWLASGINYSNTFTTSPEGLSNATIITENTSNGDHRIQDVVTVNTGATYTFSIFVKPISGTRTFMVNTSPFKTRAFFNLQNGTVESEIAGTAFIEPYGNGWYRCIVVGEPTTATGGHAFRIGMADGTTTSYQGDGTSEIAIYGAQLEEGSYPTSYIPTYGTAATRGVDDLIGSTAFNGGNAFSIYLEMGPIEGSGQILLMQTSPLDFYFRWTLASTLNIWNQDDNSALINITSQNRNQNNKILMVYDGSGGNLVFLNGTKYTANNYTWPSLDYSLRVGSQVGVFGFPAANSKTFKSILVFPEALSDADCITLTTL